MGGSIYPNPYLDRFLPSNPLTLTFLLTKLAAPSFYIFF
jgi:hypothetical protein